MTVRDCEDRHSSFASRWLQTVVFLSALLASSSFAQSLDDSCTASALNRTAAVNPDGSFQIANVPVPFGAIRVRVVCENADGTFRGSSAFLDPIASGITTVDAITFGDDDFIPVSLAMMATNVVVAPPIPFSRITTTGTLADGTQIDVTLANSGTFYLSSNPAIATVDADGFVSGISSGNVLITATHEGVIATIQLTVNLTDDTDGDGLPNDFETTNSVSPGGTNLSLSPGATVNASSFSGFPPERAIDANLQTSWFTAPGDAANRRTSPFIEVVLPQDENVAQVRLLGNRHIHPLRTEPSLPPRCHPVRTIESPPRQSGNLHARNPLPHESPDCPSSPAPPG